ncbi:MAG: type III-B CRISPR module RAMP protein Cmr4 [Saprospiraceae bacterium]|nr:type III-B CRISPR module RAMP protein Cmr4 [Candidatus Vicinibacter affinis]
MPTTKTDLYIIRCLTNLHAGSGDSTYGIIDKEVQKDPITKYPVIHASGLKGAFRELFEYHNLPGVKEIFGSDSKANEANGMQAGKYFFMEAQMLFLPVRSNRMPFYYATSPDILKRFIQEQEDFGTGNEKFFKSAFQPLLDYTPAIDKPLIFNSDKSTVNIDEYEAGIENEILVNLGDMPINEQNVASFHQKDIRSICSRLPVMARNYLENGISGNLWYEEVVPKETHFYFYLSHPESNNLFEEGLKNIAVNFKVQIGGNASVGYGLCKIIKI